MTTGHMACYKTGQIINSQHIDKLYLPLLTTFVSITHMIESFKCADTAALFAGKRVARFANIERVARRKLDMVSAAMTLDFLRVPPQNRLEALKHDRKGQWSIRINNQWRVCFRFDSGNAFDVEIVDYH